MTPTRRHHRPGRLALATLTASLLLGATACEGGLTRPWSDRDTEQLDELRADLEALTEVQTVLQWYTASQGEPSILAETYRTSNELFTSSSIDLVERALARRRLGDDEGRARE